MLASSRGDRRFAFHKLESDDGVYDCVEGEKAEQETEGQTFEQKLGVKAIDLQSNLKDIYQRRGNNEGPSL